MAELYDIEGNSSKLDSYILNKEEAISRLKTKIEEDRITGEYKEAIIEFISWIKEQEDITMLDLHKYTSRNELMVMIARRLKHYII